MTLNLISTQFVWRAICTAISRNIGEKTVLHLGAHEGIISLFECQMFSSFRIA